VSGKERLSASVDAELVAVAQDAVAEGRAESVSAWVNEALRLKVAHDQRLRALDEFVAAFEAEHGQITEAEMHEAARRARGRAVVVRGAQTSPGRGAPREQGAA
jgi:Arc/MetJ-type ribon-helix-helix transcriptional regulator